MPLRHQGSKVHKGAYFIYFQAWTLGTYVSLPDRGDLEGLPNFTNLHRLRFKAMARKPVWDIVYGQARHPPQT